MTEVEAALADASTDYKQEGHSNEAEKDASIISTFAVASGEDGDDEAARLKDLATGVRDQDDLERDIHRQADELLTAQANERDQKRLEKAKDNKE